MTTLEEFCNDMVEIVGSTDDDDAMYDAIEALDNDDDDAEIESETK